MGKYGEWSYVKAEKKIFSTVSAFYFFSFDFYTGAPRWKFGLSSIAIIARWNISYFVDKEKNFFVPRLESKHIGWFCENVINDLFSFLFNKGPKIPQNPGTLA